MKHDEKKIRSLAKFFWQLHKSEVARNVEAADAALPPLLVAEICQHIKANGLVYADLVALRGKPGKYDFGNPYDWLWLLHRAMNHHNAELKDAALSNILKQVLEDLHCIQDFESDRMSSSGVEVLSRCIQRLATLV